MGQTIEINRTTTVGNVLVIETDRSLAGQDGRPFNGRESARRVAEAAPRGGGFPAKLAVRLFDADDEVDHVHVMSNVVSVRRPGGWDDEAVERASSVVSEFFEFY